MAEELICFRCKQRPDQLLEYVIAASDAQTTPAEYVRREEGTFNPANGHFCCTECYIKLGQPVGQRGQRWVAP